MNGGYSYNRLQTIDLQPMDLYVKGEKIHGWFTSCRVDKSTIPEGKYIYELEQVPDIEEIAFCALKERVGENHGGSFIVDQKLDLGQDGQISLDFEEEENYYMF